MIDRRSDAHNLSTCEIRAGKEFRPERDSGLSLWFLLILLKLICFKLAALCFLHPALDVLVCPSCGEGSKQAVCFA